MTSGPEAGGAGGGVRPRSAPSMDSRLEPWIVGMFTRTTKTPAFGELHVLAVSFRRRGTQVTISVCI